jgi:hypothetical protein
LALGSRLLAVLSLSRLYELPPASAGGPRQKESALAKHLRLQLQGFFF